MRPPCSGRWRRQPDRIQPQLPLHAGGLGFDTITLNAANAATDTVSFVDIDNTFNRDVTTFVGFLDTANNPTGNRHDQFEFDARVW